MVGIGVGMILMGMVGLFLRWRDRLYDQRWFCRLALLMGPTGFLAVLTGWITTEAGRQPYVVYGLLRTADAVSPIEIPAVASSLTAFILVYCIVFGAGFYYILRLMAQAPQPLEEGPDRWVPQRAAGRSPVHLGESAE